MSILAFGMMFSTFFDKAKIAGQFGAFVVFILFAPFYALDAKTSPQSVFFFCLSSPIAFRLSRHQRGRRLAGISAAVLLVLDGKLNLILRVAALA